MMLLLPCHILDHDLIYAHSTIIHCQPQETLFINYKISLDHSSLLWSSFHDSAAVAPSICALRHIDGLSMPIRKIRNWNTRSLGRYSILANGQPSPSFPCRLKLIYASLSVPDENFCRARPANSLISEDEPFGDPGTTSIYM